MSSRASELESSKASGDALEAEIVQVVDELEYVSDHTATWHDARTTTVLEASRSLPFYGIVLVEPAVPVEIKGCQIETSNGSRSTRGRFYVKRADHEQLLEAAGAGPTTRFRRSCSGHHSRATSRSTANRGTSR